MIDVHAHILPGYDDGAQQMSDALIMAEMAADSGVTGIAATPYVLDDRIPDPAALHAAFAALRFALDDCAIPVELYSGMEIMATEKTPSLLAAGKLLTLNGSRYPLLEFGFSETAAHMEKILYAVQAEGFIPILAHLERYYSLQDMPQRAMRMAENGILLQLDKDSILGKMEKNAVRCAHMLLSERCVHAVASDAHRPNYRTTRLNRAQEYTALHYSFEAAYLLFEENPYSIVHDLPVKSL